jgi:hypothetical protein
MDFEGQADTLVKFFRDRDTNLVQESTLFLRRPKMIMIEKDLDDDQNKIYQKEYYPDELYTTFQAVNHHYMDHYCKLDKTSQNFISFAVYDIVNSKFNIFISNWTNDSSKDEFFIIEIRQPQNHVQIIDMSNENLFISKVDRNLIWLIH